MIIKFLAKGIRLFAEIMTVIGTILPSRLPPGLVRKSRLSRRLAIAGPRPSAMEGRPSVSDAVVTAAGSRLVLTIDIRRAPEPATKMRVLRSPVSQSAIAQSFTNSNDLVETVGAASSLSQTKNYD